MKRSILLVLAALAGCGQSGVTRVTGAVVMNQEPLNKMCVCFWPKHDHTLGIIGCGMNADDGTFDIRPNPDRGEGKPGVYAVFITPAENPQAIIAACIAKVMAPRAPLPFKLPPERYWAHETTPLTAEVLAGDNHLDPFVLEK